METITMRCITPGFGNLQFKSLLGLALAVAVGPAFAKDPAPDLKQAEKGKAGKVQSEQVAIPECLEKLNLSTEQQAKIRDIVGNYDRSMGQVWQQFGNSYMQAITLESSLLAAIEDNLTEAQRQQVRDQRRKTARHEKDVASTNTKANQVEVKPKEETTRPTTAAEESLAVIEVSLTDEQEATADKVQENYRARLRSLNRDIQGLHTRLVSLEADKLVEMEKVLTKDQLSQLRTSRQSPPAAPKVVTRKTEFKTTE
jgi:Spy/CpxP family protein refolding chaperone